MMRHRAIMTHSVTKIILNYKVSLYYEYMSRMYVVRVHWLITANYPTIIFIAILIFIITIINYNNYKDDTKTSQYTIKISRAYKSFHIMIRILDK